MEVDLGSCFTRRVCASTEELSLGERSNLMSCDVLPNLLGTLLLWLLLTRYGDIIFIAPGCLQYKCLRQDGSEWKCSVNCLENEKNPGAQENCPTAGCTCEKKCDLITSVALPWVGRDWNSEKGCICFMIYRVDFSVCSPERKISINKTKLK